MTSQHRVGEDAVTAGPRWNPCYVPVSVLPTLLTPKQ